MKIFVMALEPLETRYTGQWYEGLPRLIRDEATLCGRTDIEVINVPGEQVSLAPTPGAFLDFSATNIWKNTQVNTMAEWFANGTIQAGDHVLFTDAWHTGVIQMRYMSELLGVPLIIHSMWHAGSYDPQDFLGRLIKDKSWTHNAERSFFHASHFNYFATKYHQELLFETLFGFDQGCSPHTRANAFEKMVISGQPHAALVEALEPFKSMKKEKLILFPHRLAPEKQPEIFRDLALHMPDVEFIVCQDKKLSKDEYHELLGKAMIVFSANLQETLGISAMEGVLVDAIPFVPNRLSYSEMYDDEFLYPSKWTESWDDYLTNRQNIIDQLYGMIENYDSYLELIAKNREILMEKYLYPGPMLDRLLGGSNG